MSNLVQTIPIKASAVDLSWMAGRMVTEIVLRDPDFWVWKFSDGGSIVTESAWRLVNDERFFVADSDPDPAANAIVILDTAKVTGFELRKGSVDLVVHFDSGHRLEVLSVGRCYEAWQVCCPSGVCYAVQSGQVSTWKQ